MLHTRCYVAAYDVLPRVSADPSSNDIEFFVDPFDGVWKINVGELTVAQNESAVLAGKLTNQPTRSPASLIPRV